MLILDATGVFVPFVESIYFPFLMTIVLLDGNGFLILNRYKVLFDEKSKAFLFPYDVFYSR